MGQMWGTGGCAKYVFAVGWVGWLKKLKVHFTPHKHTADIPPTKNTDSVKSIESRIQNIRYHINTSHLFQKRILKHNIQWEWFLAN